MKVSTLKIKWKRRVGGGGRTERNFLDFIVDGKGLSESINRDLVSCLGWFVDPENEKVVNRLLLSEINISHARQPLYVCPECGDLSCGGVTALIEERDGLIVWRDFGFENNYEDEIERLDHIGNFYFEIEQYINTLREAINLKSNE